MPQVGFHTSVRKVPVCQYVPSQKSTGCEALKILTPNGEAVADLATVVV